MTIDLAGRTAIVTGARHGLGAATAIALAGAGARVAVCGRRAGDCAAVVQAIEEAGGRALDAALDVADLANVKSRVAEIADRLGGLDVVVNNAATIEPMAPVAALDAEKFDLAMRVNVSGAAAVVTAAWPRLAGHGRIVNLLSGAAVRPLHGWAAYCSGKAALLMLTRAIDAEGKVEGIRCFGIAPGLVDTAMQASIRAAGINEVSSIPQEKLSDPKVAAKAIAWLASGAGDDYAGAMVDVRDTDFMAKVNG
ncbi:SDR family oxidoreductase [Shinella yambaruensis]|uniref:Short-chain dehydrogenase n=1 Tax=Shinella yambaruensis TaxID=415996 RepID=A0ABQ5ZP53_9HYPH|nr:SDR family oxidoreductase [Shinella yambaruensis]MCJ8028395.1 SDR family oxidoreductase [Shinella yambaruensis]MCU7981448.1 SDR family oxidoreductase [Shinella yambaruensis]GLR53521.1 short-chain dehydrogenase [Shinella yambaruensis]